MPRSSMRNSAIVASALNLALTACLALAPMPSGLPSVAVGSTESCVVDGGSAYCWGLRGQVEVTASDGARLWKLDPGVFQFCGLTNARRVICSAEMVPNTLSPRRCSFLCLFPVEGDSALGTKGFSSGYYHACALNTARAAFCWGSNSMGQLGNGHRADNDPPGSGGARVLTPERVVGNQEWRQISAGETHTCALTMDGEAYCWGYGQSGELGRDTVMTYCSGPLPQSNEPCSVDRPVRVETDIRFRAISAGMRLTCAISRSNDVYCWGSNYRCALGRCEAPGFFGPSLIPLPRKAATVEAGYWFACATTVDSRAYCWGDNNHGQLGSLRTDEFGRCFNGGRCSPTPVEVSGNYRWKSVSAGEFHACGVTVGGEVFCWGSTDRSRIPTPVPFEYCVNNSKEWPDVPCASRPIRVWPRQGMPNTR